MSKAINEDVCIIGSDLIIGVYFPKVDGKHSFASLLAANHITVKYYIINTAEKFTVSSGELYAPLEEDDPRYNDIRAFNVDTTGLKEGVLMVEVVAEIPDSRFGDLGLRTEIARCSSGIAIIK